MEATPTFYIIGARIYRWTPRNPTGYLFDLHVWFLYHVLYSQMGTTGLLEPIDSVVF